MSSTSDQEQNSYVFICGKNWRLSLAELVSFLRTRETGFRITGFSKSFFTVVFNRVLDQNVVGKLGGIIKVGTIRSRVPLEPLKKAFLRHEKLARENIETKLSADCPVDEIFEAPENRIVFGVSIYSENHCLSRFSWEIQRFLGTHFKKELASEDIRSKFMGLPKTRKLPQLTHVEVLKKKLIEDSAEILFCIDEQQAYLAKSIAVHNPFEFQKRDIDRPVQRKIFSIPPRLAKIMVNLSDCQSGKTFLDPFCGVGTILQEAMLARAEVVGLDNNPWCVKAAEKNLEWIKDQYNLKAAKYRVLLGNSRKLANHVDAENIDCIATEPDLGPALRHLPTEHYAEEIVDRLRPLYYDFLEEAYKVLKSQGKLVLVTPLVKTRSERPVALKIEERAEAIGFQIVHPFEKADFAEYNKGIDELSEMLSFIDAEERHKIGREIHIFRK
jgi:tRNA G10  N-methylase Trm11